VRQPKGETRLKPTEKPTSVHREARLTTGAQAPWLVADWSAVKLPQSVNAEFSSPTVIAQKKRDEP
jgi:hypothetical protein